MFRRFSGDVLEMFCRCDDFVLEILWRRYDFVLEMLLRFSGNFMENTKSTEKSGSDAVDEDDSPVGN